MPHVLALPLVALTLALAGCMTPPPEEPPIIVPNDPGSQACAAQSGAGGFDLVGIDSPDFVTDASGSVSGAAYAMRVRDGARTQVVRCVYSYDTGQATLG